LTVGVCIACESATMSWSAVLLRQEAPRWAAFAGLGAAFFAACQAALRFNADWLRLHLSDRSLILVSLAVAAIGLGIVAAHAGFASSVIGFAIVGIGTGSIVPCGFALAASRPNISAGASISAVAFIGGFPRLPSPLITGAVATAFSLSTAFLCLAALLLAAFAGVVAFVPGQQQNARSARLVRSPRRLSS
jgi:MFS family permease